MRDEERIIDNCPAYQFSRDGDSSGTVYPHTFRFKSDTF